MGWRGAHARVLALLVGKPVQQMKNFTEIKKIEGFFFQTFMFLMFALS